MVPPGIPGRSDADFLPAHDPDGARALLAEAGYPGGTRLPEDGPPRRRTEDRAFAAEIQRELGVTIDVEVQGDGFFDRLAQDPPQIFSMGWIADYPGPNDFLGILLGTGASNNYGRWSSSAFDGAVTEALAAPDPAAARAAFDTAEGIVRDEAPVIPLSYGVELVAGAGPASSAPIRTGSGSSGWQGSHGPAERRSDAGVRRSPPSRRSRRSPPSSCRCWSRSPVAAADPVRFGQASRQLVRSGTASTSDQPVTLPAGAERVEILVSTPGRDRPDRPARRRSRRPATRPSTTSSTPTDGGLVPNTPFTASGGSSTRTGPRPSGPPSRTPTPTTASTGRRSKGTSSGSTGSRATRRSASAP